METLSKVCCPKCSSESISANKKGFSGKKAVAGAVLTGGVGLLAGTIGSNRIVVTCLNCGHQWRPGAPAAKPSLSPEQLAKRRRINKIVWPVLIGIILLFFLLLKFG